MILLLISACGSNALADPASHIYDLLDYDAKASITYAQLQEMHGDYGMEEPSLIAGFKDSLINAIRSRYSESQQAEMVNHIHSVGEPPVEMSRWLNEQVIRSLYWFSDENSRTIYYNAPK